MRLAVKADAARADTLPVVKLSPIDAVLARSADLASACQAACEAIAATGRLSACAYVARAGRLRAVADAGLAHVRDGVPVAMGAAGRALRSASEQRDTGLDGAAIICVPIVADGMVCGVLEVGCASGLESADEEEARQTAIALGGRFESLGGVPPESASGRLAQHAAAIAGLEDPSRIERATLVAALDLAEMETAVLLRREDGGQPYASCAAGPLAHPLLAIDDGDAARARGRRRRRRLLGDHRPAWPARASGAARRTAGVRRRHDRRGPAQLARRAAGRAARRRLARARAEHGARRAARARRRAGGELPAHRRPPSRSCAIAPRPIRSPASVIAAPSARCSPPRTAARSRRASRSATSTTSRTSTTASATRPATRRSSAVAEALQSALRRGDTLYRLGGDEFAALLAVRDEDDALAAAQRMREAVVESDAGVTVSVGVAVFGGLGVRRLARRPRRPSALPRQGRGPQRRRDRDELAAAATG